MVECFITQKQSCIHHLSVNFIYIVTFIWIEIIDKTMKNMVEKLVV